MSYYTNNKKQNIHIPSQGLRSHRIYEEYAFILDILPYRRTLTDKMNMLSPPTAQVIGEKYFTLLEIQLKPGVVADIQERIYIGKDQRNKVLRIVSRINFNELTTSAKGELEEILERIVIKQETRFLEFFNKSSAITPRMHSLELLPGIGKKSMWQIITERERSFFSNFQDLKERVKISEPHRLIAKRILEEIMGESKYKIFTRVQ